MLKHTHDHLVSRLQRLLEGFELFLTQPNDDRVFNEVMGLVSNVERKGAEIEFKIANRSYLLRGEILLSQATILIRTFEFVPSIVSYGELNFVHYDEIDIVMSIQGTRFVRLIERHNPMSPNPTIIERFGLQYLEQLWQAIENREKREMPELV